MTQIDSLIAEFGHEARTTRRHLERLPADYLDWRPHAKSSTLLALGSHIVDCIGWTDSIFSSDELDINPATYAPYTATGVIELLAGFDDKVTIAARALAAASDADLRKPWRLKFKGRVRFEKPKADVFRDFTLSHLIHHRGQFSVYLRLLDVPVPGSYGPTADEP
jgi:uncharacterized damage-inducible protein DinB